MCVRGCTGEILTLTPADISLVENATGSDSEVHEYMYSLESALLHLYDQELLSQMQNHPIKGIGYKRWQHQIQT